MGGPEVGGPDAGGSDVGGLVPAGGFDPPVGSDPAGGLVPAGGFEPPFGPDPPLGFEPPAGLDGVSAAADIDLLGAPQPIIPVSVNTAGKQRNSAKLLRFCFWRFVNSLYLLGLSKSDIDLCRSNIRRTLPLTCGYRSTLSRSRRKQTYKCKQTYK